MMRKCHLNTCPVGIATQDPELRRKFSGSPDHVVNYFFKVAEELRQIMAYLGFSTVNEMVGRTDVLYVDDAIDHWKASGLDLSSILSPARIIYEGTEVYRTIDQNHNLDKALDNELIRLAQPAIQRGHRVDIEMPVINTNRVVGTMLSHEVAKATGGKLCLRIPSTSSSTVPRVKAWGRGWRKVSNWKLKEMPMTMLARAFPEAN